MPEKKISLGYVESRLMGWKAEITCTLYIYEQVHTCTISIQVSMFNLKSKKEKRREGAEMYM